MTAEPMAADPQRPSCPPHDNTHQEVEAHLLQPTERTTMPNEPIPASSPEVLVSQPAPRPPEPDTDPSTVTGLVYRILTRWRVMLGAIIAILVIAAALVLTFRLLGPLHI